MPVAGRVERAGLHVMNDPTDQRSSAKFPTTCWSRVVAAGDRDARESREALIELCRAYWFPLYAFIRRKGHGPDPSLDLTQSYFARLLESWAVASANPTMSESRTCPNCGATRPVQGPEGLCPRCLLRVGLDGDIESQSPSGEAGPR
jgi:hypothetical protein